MQIHACRVGRTDCAKALVRAGCNVAVTSNNGWSAREWADELGHMGLMKWMLREAETEASKKAKAGELARAELAQAATDGALTELDRLLDERVDPNGGAPAKNLCGERVEATPLAAAARGSQHEAARRLLDRGALPAQPDSRGVRPLGTTFAGLPGADGRRTQVTPLMEAASAGSAAVTRLLLKRGGGADLVDRCPCLHTAPH